MNSSRVLFLASGVLLFAAGIQAVWKNTVTQTQETSPGVVRGPGHAAPAPANPGTGEQPLADAFGFSDPQELESAQRLRVVFTTGAYAKALALIEEQLARHDISTGFRSWLQAQLPVVLASDGWSAIATGDCEHAVESLRRAAQMAFEAAAPGTMQADIRRGLGYCLKKSGAPGGAEENLLQALKFNPADDESRFMLADLYESDGRFSEAVHTLEEGPQTPDSNKRLEVMRRRASEGDLQQTQRSQHFNISFRANAHEGLAAKAVQILEASLDEFVDRFGYREPATPIEVILYPTERFSWALGGVPDWAEGIFDGRMRIPVRHGSPDGIVTPVLRHELIHALNANMTGGRPLPPWLEEGLAQRLGEMTAGGSFPFPVKPAPFAPATDFAASYMSFGTAAAGSIYRQSLYLIMTLENLEGDALRHVITSLSATGPTNADAVLAPVGGLTFDRLYGIASANWKARIPLAAR